MIRVFIRVLGFLAVIVVIAAVGGFAYLLSQARCSGAIGREGENHAG